MNITNFYKNCPNCNEIIYYETISKLNRSLKNNSNCYPCSVIIKRDARKIITNNLSYYNPDTNLWFKPCPECSNNITYQTYQSYMAGYKNNAICIFCATKKFSNTPEFKQKASDRMKKNKNDPNSPINSKDAENKRAKSIKIARNKEGNPWCSDENKKRQALLLKSQRDDPDSLLNKSYQTEEYHQKLSEASRKKWLNPNSKLNTPEYRQAAGQRLQKGRFKLGLNTSKGELALFKEIEHLGFIHNDFSIKIDRFYPDMIHDGYKIIVEYYGDLFHANPNNPKYKEDDAIVNLPREKQAGDIRKYDQERKEILENLGYKVHIVWASDFTKKKKKVIEEIISLFNASYINHYTT